MEVTFSVAVTTHPGQSLDRIYKINRILIGDLILSNVSSLLLLGV